MWCLLWIAAVVDRGIDRGKVSSGMGEGYWERKQRHLTEDHAARRKESERTIGLIKSQDRLDRITAGIESATTGGNEPGAFSDEFRRLSVEWIVKKTSTLAEIDSNPYLSAEVKTAWSGTLRETALTDFDDENLTGLRRSILFEAIKFDPRPGRPAGLIALATSIAALIETRTQARAEW